MELRKILAALPFVLSPALVFAEDACVAPGILIAEDPVGDAANGAGGTEGTGLPFSDIEFLHVAEPASLQNRLVFTLKVVSLAEPLLPLHRWVVYFTLPDGVQWYAAMSTADGELPGFEYGTTSILDAAAATVGQFTYVGDLDAASSFNADGTISLVVDTAAVGLKPGDLADFIFSKVRRSTVRETQNIGLTLDDTGSGGFYTLAGNANCSAGKSSGLLGAGALSLPVLLGLLGFAALARHRAVAGLLLASVLAAAPAIAADPASGKISHEQPAAEWSGELLTPNPGGSDVPVICEEGTPTCDVYRFEADLPDANLDDDLITIKLEWSAPAEQVDIDIYVYDDSTGEQIAAGTASGGGAEAVFMPAASGKYRVDVIPWAAAAQSYTGVVKYEKYEEGKSDLALAGSSGAGTLLALVLGFALRRRATTI